jgi:hypothetical protein
LKQVLADILQEKWKVSTIQKISAWLDPRQKNHLESVFGASVQESVEIKSNTVKLAKLYYRDPQISTNNDPSEEAEGEHSSTFRDIFSASTSKPKSSSFDVQIWDEINSYDSLKLSSHTLADFDILKWWQSNQLNFPILNKLARSILCIPASSSKPETVFSAAGFIKAPRRSNLAPEVLDDLLVSKSNLDLTKYA